MKCVVVFLLCFLSVVSFSQNRILVDGIFDEWEEFPLVYMDVQGDDGFSGIDFGQLKIYNDDEYLFIYIEIGDEINLQDLNEITLYLDTDDNLNTGFGINGIGADMVYSFGERSGVFYNSGNSTDIYHADIGLVSAPTVTSDRFEIAIKRGISISGNPIFPEENLKFVFKDNGSNGDVLPAVNDFIEYSFSTAELDPLPIYSISQPNDSDIRIISYNVLDNGIFDQSRIPSFFRIFQATRPDIIGFQEIYNYSSKQVADQIESILPSSAGQEWYHAKEGPDCHAISKYPILESASIPSYNQGAGNGAFLIDLPDDEINLLLIVAHPPCCDNDYGRQIEVDLIMEFLREAKDGNGPIPLETNTPIVIVGDMNFVGEHQQLQTLLTGNIDNEASYGPDFNPDWDGSNLLDSRPNTTGVPFAFTWYNEGSYFSPGRLDYIIYSGSNLVLKNNYSLFTPGLPVDSLNTYELFQNDVLIASDHLPIIADFELNILTKQKDLTLTHNLGIQEIYPNPSYGLIEVSFSINQRDIVSFELLDQTGKIIHVIPSKSFKTGDHKFQINTASLPSGLYILNMQTSKFRDSKKIVLVN